MDIVFELGEYYFENESSFWIDLLITFLGSFFGFGFSLLFYYRKKREQRKKEEESKENDQKNLLFYFKCLLEVAVKRFNDQLTKIDEFIEKQESSLTEMALLNQIIENEYVRLKNIDNRGVFEAWVTVFKTEESIKEYNNLNNQLDYLEGTREEIKRIYFRNVDKCDAFFQDFKNLIESTSDNLASHAGELIGELGESRKKDPYYNFINDAIGTFTEIVETVPIVSPKVYDERFLFPLITTFQEKYSDKEISDMIITSCKRARVKLNDIEFQMNNTISQFKMARERTSKSLEFVQNAIQKLDEIKQESTS